MMWVDVREGYLSDSLEDLLEKGKDCKITARDSFLFAVEKVLTEFILIKNPKHPEQHLSYYPYSEKSFPDLLKHAKEYGFEPEDIEDLKMAFRHIGNNNEEDFLWCANKVKELAKKYNSREELEKQYKELLQGARK